MYGGITATRMRRMVRERFNCGSEAEVETVIDAANRGVDVTNCWWVTPELFEQRLESVRALFAHTFGV